jgi:U5 small nuclear ribonucleoprotein component
VDHVRFASKLWGDSYFNASSRTFQQRPPSSDAPRSFVEFILEPMYKIITCVLGEAAADVKHTLAQVKVFLKSSLYSLDAKPLLRIALSSFFESSSGFVDAVVQHLPSPISGAARRVSRYYTGDQTSAAAANMRACSAEGVLAMNVFKLYHTADCSVFDVLAYVVSGRVHKGTAVKVLGETYTLVDEEDCATAVVQGISVPCGRYKVDVDSAGPGNLVLLSGIDAPVLKSATVTSPVGSDGMCTFLPIRHNTVSTVRLAIEPLNPAELPRMLDGLRRVSKSYPLLRTKVEESGEHVIVGTGELYLDCVMHDLRLMYAEIEVKTADPCVSFCETIVETSSLKCFAETPNKKNKLTMIAEPLDKGMADAIESGILSLGLGPKALAQQLQTNFNWDVLAARSVWAFGPEEKGCNVLLDDTLPSEVDKKLLSTVRSSVVQGFQWGCREGPLCDEPIRNVKFRLIDASIDPTPLHRGGGQIIPTARRVAYSAFLMATPRLMEPVYHVEITSPADCVTAIYNVISRRRGMIVKEFPKAGTPLYVAHAVLPVIESFGFETDLRSHTQGQAMSLSVFDHWSIVPGDPLDKSIVLRPLEIQPPIALAREFMVKTRRRKGMSEDVRCILIVQP